MGIENDELSDEMKSLLSAMLADTIHDIDKCTLRWMTLIDHTIDPKEVRKFNEYSPLQEYLKKNGLLEKYWREK